MIETERVVSKGARLQPFILTGYHGVPTHGSVTIQAFDREQRWRRVGGRRSPLPAAIVTAA